MTYVIDAEETKRRKARELRYKKPIVRNINLDKIKEDLWDIVSECEEVVWYFDGDDDSLINALDGNDDEAYEFKMMFADLCAECEQMQSDLENEYVPGFFDSFFVAAGTAELGGGLLGWDAYEQDYFGIGCSDSFAENEAVKKLMRLTKEQMIEGARACLRVLYSYLGLMSRYDSLKAALDILRDENTAHLKVARQIEEIYEKANEDHFREWADSTKELDRLVRTIPNEVWMQ